MAADLRRDAHAVDRCGRRGAVATTTGVCRHRQPIRLVVHSGQRHLQVDRRRRRPGPTSACTAPATSTRSSSIPANPTSCWSQHSDRAPAIPQRDRERGVYRTTDGGRNWARVLPADGNERRVRAELRLTAIRSVVYATLQGAGGGRGAERSPRQAAGGGHLEVDRWRRHVGADRWPWACRRRAVRACRRIGHARTTSVWSRFAAAVAAAVRRTAASTAPTTAATTGPSAPRQIASAGGHIYADPQQSRRRLPDGNVDVSLGRRRDGISSRTWVRRAVRISGCCGSTR